MASEARCGCCLIFFELGANVFGLVARSVLTQNYVAVTAHPYCFLHSRDHVLTMCRVPRWLNVFNRPSQAIGLLKTT